MLSSEFLTTTRRDGFLSAQVMDFYALLDDRDQALAWLENAVDRGFINYPYLSKHDPFLTKLRDDPRFKEILARVRIDWERFKV